MTDPIITDVVVTEDVVQVVEVVTGDMPNDIFVSIQQGMGLPGPVGPEGPPGASTTIEGSGFPSETVGIAGSMYREASTGTLYGPKLVTKAPGLTSQVLLGNAWYPEPTSATNVGPLELGTEFQVTAGEIDLTAIRFFRERRDVQATTQVTVWNVVGGAQIHRTTLAVAPGQGWRIVPLSAAVRLGVGNYVVSYTLADANARSPHATTFPLVPQVANVRLTQWRYSYTAGAYPASPGTTLMNYVDPVFTPISSWQRTETKTLSGSGFPAETLGYTGDTYVDRITGVQYGPKQATGIAQTPSQSLYYPTTPSIGPLSDPAGFELGVEFICNTSGLVNGVRYLRIAADTQTTRFFRLWNATTQAKLGEVQSTTETGTGWRYIPFASPVRIGAGNYIVTMSVNANVSIGVYAPANNAAFVTPTRNLSMTGGRYVQVPGSFPTVKGQPYWYGVDVDFTPEPLWPMTGLDAPRQAQVDVFKGRVVPYPTGSTSDTFTWIKPVGAKLVQVILQGPGAGGSSGRRGATGTVRGGGAGGGGGMRREFWFAAADLPDSVVVAVSTATGGAPGVTTDDTDGNSAGPTGGAEFRTSPLYGSALNPTYTHGGANGFGGKVNGGGGSGGPLGVSSSAATSATGGAGPNNNAGTPNMYVATMPGAGGGGVSAANAFGVGGSAYGGQFSNNEYALKAGGATDGAAGVESTVTDFPAFYPLGFGAGGSGGAGSVAGPGGKGAKGVRGGGGGGGGGSTNGQVSGAGGDGGVGYVMVITYF